ncbi:hypothetical protein ACFZ8E_13120 [Methylobacterium sp. HMF5984]|uniref:hypothetical protein n=1 Tax=Methylobacterium sp. HMF5984 TaxID=3367370 RepID=UPI0038532E51
MNQPSSVREDPHSVPQVLTSDNRDTRHATTLYLINTLAWEQRKGDATKNDGFYDLGNAPAQPEAAT